MFPYPKKTLWIYLLWSFATGTGYAQSSEKDTLRLFVIGNSFSQNATRYLPQLAAEKERGLVIGRAELGGSPLKRHWEHAEAAEADSLDPKGRPYHGKSLRMLLSEGTWHIVTIQQYSMHSTDPATYEPYARKLFDYIKAIQPQAEVVLHQTWAYRSDADGFGQIGEEKFTQSEKEMWEKSRKAYHEKAQKLGIRIIPVGDAFWKNSSDPEWGYRKDPKLDSKNSEYPALPDQSHSLHAGYRWTNDKKMGFDSHHANEAGCYLGSLVWYAFLFDQSPLQLSFVPENISAAFAAQLRKVAATTVAEARKQR